MGIGSKRVLLNITELVAIVDRVLAKAMVSGEWVSCMCCIIECAVSVELFIFWAIFESVRRKT